MVLLVQKGPSWAFQLTEMRSGDGKTKTCSAQQLGRGAAPRDEGEGSLEGAECKTQHVAICARGGPDGETVPAGRRQRAL